MIKLFRAIEFNKICILLVACFFMTIALYAQSKIQAKPVNLSEKTRLKGFVQDYRLVTDVLDAFGGESESDYYRISVNGGGQPSSIGISGRKKEEEPDGYYYFYW